MDRKSKKLKISKILLAFFLSFLLSCTVENDDDKQQQEENKTTQTETQRNSEKNEKKQQESETSQTNNQNNSENENKNQQETATSTIIWNGSKDFNDSSWGINIQISAENFSKITEYSKIQVEWVDSQTATQYKKLQFDYMGNNGWAELIGGNFSGGHTDSEAGVVPDSSPLSYTLTKENAQILKQSGLALMGYGVIVTKIEILTENTSSKENENSSSHENEKKNTDSTESEVSPQPTPNTENDTPFAKHGKLHVSGAYLYDKNNEKYQLYGMSTHGIYFGDDFSKYVNEETFKTLVDDWNTNCIRIVLYPRDYNGYCNGGDKAKLKEIVTNGIEAATKCGMYVLVDWHVHNYNPLETQSEAITFLSEISAKYKNYENILYEICNEPTGSPWNSVIKPYAEAVIPKIHENAPDALIIVGTNTWSQDVEEPLQNPLAPEIYGNVMYTFHFYANSHTDSFRTRVENAIKNGLPIFITEFGTCDASGNGGLNSGESQKWFDLCKEYKISHLNWSLCNKGESASAIASWCNKTSNWNENELSDSGKIVREHFKTLTK